MQPQRSIHTALGSGLPPLRARISPPSPPPHCVLTEVCNDHVSFLYYEKKAPPWRGKKKEIKRQLGTLAQHSPSLRVAIYLCVKMDHGQFYSYPRIPRLLASRLMLFEESRKEEAAHSPPPLLRAHAGDLHTFTVSLMELSLSAVSRRSRRAR